MKTKSGLSNIELFALGRYCKNYGGMVCSPFTYVYKMEGYKPCTWQHAINQVIFN